MSKNTSFRVTNDSSQRERRAIAENDRQARQGVAYSKLAASDAGIARGRFTAHERSTVIGSGPITYPALPSNSPWHHDPVPAEEPIGFDVSAAPVVGEVHEIRKSLRETSDGEGVIQTAPSNGSPKSGDGLRSSGPLHPRSSAPSPPSKRKRHRRG